MIILIVIQVGLLSGSTDANTYYFFYEDKSILPSERAVCVTLIELAFDCAVFTASILGSIFCHIYQNNLI
jgi:hypothetical protein